MPLFADWELGAANFENGLAAPAPSRARLKPSWGMLALLLLACLLPRAIMAWKVDIICEDGPVYIESARQLEAGNLNSAFRDTLLGLNLYPVVLAALHGAGLDWLTAGRLWGMCMSTLVVLPMFGWSRRQFNDRVATVACLLYIVHPTLLERSPEVLRCSTFWFLLMLGMYLGWRAVTEVRVWLFAAAGLTFALAVHTRVEAWLMLMPLGLWTCWRMLALTSDRPRLALGAATGLAMLPLLVLSVNLTWLKDHPRWEFCLSDRFVVLSEQLWPKPAPEPAPPTAEAAPQPAAPVAAVAAAPIAAPVSTAPVSAAPAAAAPADDLTSTAAELKSSRLVWGYVRKMVDAFDPVFGVLTLIGLWQWRRVFLRRDQQSVFLFSLLCLAAIWLFWVQIHELIGRYFFPVVLLSTSYAALGLFSLAGGLRRLGDRVQFGAFRWPAAVPAVMLVVVTMGLADALTNRYDSRRQRLELGQWILSTVGPDQWILGSEPRSWITAYYAQGRYFGPPHEAVGTEHYRQLVAHFAPAVVLIKTEGDPLAADWQRRFESDQATRVCYTSVPAEQLPASCRELTVLMRNRPPAELVRRPR